MMPDELKRARLVLIQALVEDPEFRQGCVDKVSAVLDTNFGFPFVNVAEEALNRLFPKAELDAVGVPLSAPPPAKKPRLLTVGERFYYPKTKQCGHILSISQNPNMPIARVLFEDNRPATLPLRSLVEPP